MIWGDFLAELREELGDTGDTPKWSDELLYSYARDGINDYSLYFPLEIWDVTLTAEEGDDTKYALPSDFLEVISVECPEDAYLEPRRGRPGVIVTQGTRPLFYHIANGFLVLDASPGGEDVILGYKAYHGVPANTDDTSFELTFSERDNELIKLYVEAKVNTRARNRQANLDRFKVGSGARDDNPMIIEAQDYFARYMQKIYERKQSKPILLYRPRRTR